MGYTTLVLDPLLVIVIKFGALLSNIRAHIMFLFPFIGSKQSQGTLKVKGEKRVLQTGGT